MKDGRANYLWQPSPVAGAQATLLGLPMTEAAAMLNIAALSASVIFGDFKCDT